MCEYYRSFYVFLGKFGLVLSIFEVRYKIFVLLYSIDIMLGLPKSSKMATITITLSLLRCFCLDVKLVWPLQLTFDGKFVFFLFEKYTRKCRR